jgi:hypothetical protein
VTRARADVAPAAAAFLLVLGMSGCSGPETTSAPSREPARSAPSTPAASSSTITPTPSESQSHTGLATPATRAGSLSRRAFPRPRELGARWSYAVDPGDAEEGYLGNGTPALERDPREIVQLAVPFGCPRPNPMPRPAHALEVDYTAGDVKVIAIRGEFPDAAAAEEFFTGRAGNLDRCRGRSGGQAIGTFVSQVERPGAGVLLSDRTPGSDPWTELAVLDGDQVVLVAARTTIDRLPMTRAGVRRLATLFRR